MFPVLDNSGWISKNGERKIYAFRVTGWLAGLFRKSYLNINLSCSGPVELAEEDGLPCSQQKLAVLDDNPYG
jgi:hypothetical protein